MDGRMYVHRMLLLELTIVTLKLHSQEMYANVFLPVPAPAILRPWVDGLNTEATWLARKYVSYNL